jgi:hypothetical protein
MGSARVGLSRDFGAQRARPRAAREASKWRKSINVGIDLGRFAAAEISILP